MGFLEENKAVLLLPRTGANGAEIVTRRIMQALDGTNLVVRNVPMKIKLAVAGETVQKDRTPNLLSLLARLDAKLSRLLKP